MACISWWSYSFYVLRAELPAELSKTLGRAELEKAEKNYALIATNNVSEKKCKLALHIKNIYGIQKNEDLRNVWQQKVDKDCVREIH